MKARLTAKLVKSLEFPCRPVGVDQKQETWIYDGAKLPKGVRDWSIRDTKTPGFGVRLTVGSKTYFVQRKRGGSTSDRYVLTDQHSLTAARKQAERWLASMARGEDPRQERAEKNNARALQKKRTAMTFGVVLTHYTEGGVNLRKATRDDRKLAARWLEREALWSVPLFDLGKAHVHATFAPMFANALAERIARAGSKGHKRGGGPHTDVASAWKALRHCAAAWTTSEEDKPAANPFAAWRREHRKTLPAVARRETSLPTNRDSGVAWLKALCALAEAPDHATTVVADYMLCVLLWGGRRKEIQTLRWQDVDEHEGTVLFRAEVTKTRRNLWLPLTPWSRTILRQRRERNAAAGFLTEADSWIFPSVQAGRHVVELRDVQTLLKEASGLWIGPHDLRRTLASDVFGDTRNVRTVGLALGHAASDSDVSAGYLPDAERLRSLRPLYEARERRLRALVGFEAKADPLTPGQRAVAEAAATMLKAAGIQLEDVAKGWETEVL